MSAPVESSGPGGIPKECHGLWGMLFGHKFEARYDEVITSHAPPIKSMSVFCDAEVLAALGRLYNDTRSTYAHDVCVRCGMVINRN